jgi:hypothetical protein
METAIKAHTDLVDFLNQLGKTTEKDFSGYTEFDSLSPDVKIEWLDEIARFIEDVFN